MYRCVLVLGLSVLAASPASVARQVQSRTVYVSAVDKSGMPVTGLRAGDLALAEDGRPRQIALVELAREMPKIAVVLDDDGTWNQPLRDAVCGFLQAMRGKAEVGLFSVARAEWTVADYTRDMDALIDVMQRQTATTRDTDHLETLLESVARKFGKDETKRPFILIVSPGAATRTISPRWDLVLKEILKSHTTVFSVGPADNNLKVTAAEQSGGRMEYLVASTGLPTALRGIADEILGQYAVTYDSMKAPGDGLRIKVKPNRNDIKVYVPERVF